MENTIIARNYKLENKELAKATAAIVKATESAAKSLLKIASIMAEVEARSLYADDFKSIAEYGDCVFGYKKSAVYNMVRIGRDYIDPTTGKSVLALENGQDFTFNQLTRLLPLKSVDVAKELVAEEVITPDMTLREIENAVKEYIHKDDASEGSEGEGEPVEGEEAPVEEEPDEIAMQFLSAKTALARLAELLADDTNTAEILTEMKTRLEIIENGGARSFHARGSGTGNRPSRLRFLRVYP